MKAGRGKIFALIGVAVIVLILIIVFVATLSGGGATRPAYRPGASLIGQ